jgi:ubiquinone/menaquinone biosynthesis methyltransferase
MNQNKKVDFGFSKVDYDRKHNLVNGVFSSVASKYDVMNDLMSLGLHRYWKKNLLGEITDLEGRILDMASGTGDVSIKLHQYISSKNIVPNITSCDANEEMLQIGRKKAIDAGILGISYEQAFAEKLPFNDESFDYYIVCFGIRNFTDISKSLEEAHRVLKRGGKLICMEFSKAKEGITESLYDFYSMNILPLMGKIVAGDGDSYRYLAESIRKFPSRENFKKTIEKSGFSSVEYKSMSLDVVTIHTGYKIAKG